MVHKVAAAAIASRPEHGVLSLDISAAFTSLRKTEVVCSVERTMPELTPWIAGLMNHRATASCKLDDGELDFLVLDGLDQGCPMSALLWCVGTACWISAIERAARSVDPNAIVLAYLDDLIIISTPAGLLRAQRAAAEEGLPLGLSLNVSKSEVYIPPGVADCPDLQGKRIAVPTVMRAELFAPQVIGTGDSSTGCFVASSDDNLASFLNTRAEFFDKLEVMLQSGLSLQNTWTLFKTKASSDWTWIARTVGNPPFGGAAHGRGY